MPILGSYPGDVLKCLQSRRPGSPACRRVYFGYYLWPRLAKILEAIDLQPSPPAPSESQARLESVPQLLEDLIALHLQPHFGDPSPQPSFPVEMRVKVTTELRDGLAKLVEELDHEIAHFRKQPPGADGPSIGLRTKQ